MKKHTQVLISVAASTLFVAGVPSGAAAGVGTCPLPTYQPGGPYSPQLDRSGFTADVTNPYYPLRPGTTFVYAGKKDGQKAIDLVVPTARTQTIDGVPTRVVADRLYLDGKLREKTSDYYAQDGCGNVWYFGEDTVEIDPHGRPGSTEGSFRAGVNGAQPGVFMPAAPQSGPWYRQEWAAGHAEDRFTVRSTSTPVIVPAGRFGHALRTEERTRLESGVVDNKYYERGIGEVEEVTVKGGTEKLVLVEVIR